MGRWSITQEILAKTFAKGEAALNLIGYIPMVSTLSAGVRMLGGKLQVVIGFCFGIYSLAVGIKSSRGKIRHFVNFRTCVEHFVHGILNMLRALIEAVPFLSLILCLPYDHFFKKRFKYALEDSDVIDVEVIKDI